MINAETLLFTTVQNALLELYSLQTKNIIFQKTRKEFEGDFTLVTFPYTKETKKSPEHLGQELGDYLLKNNSEISGFNVVKGFLNISLSNTFWLDYFNSIKHLHSIGFKKENSSGKTIMLEYSSPNTNKPLHLGHVRNNLLGYSVAQILKANGHKVIKTNLVNDRGIHICKSMLAWQKFGKGETPKSSGMKGDHLVGKYYVQFETELKKQMEPILAEIYKGTIGSFSTDEQTKLNNHLIKKEQLKSVLKKEVDNLDWDTISKVDQSAQISCESALDENIKWKDVVKNFMSKQSLNSDQKVLEEKQKKIQVLLKTVIAIEEKIDAEIEELKDFARSKTAFMKEASEMLRQWEAGNTEIINLWKTMNSWVYEGFDLTYKALGVNFDKMYYESNTYLLGKEVVQEGLDKKVFYKKDNGSVAIDLSADGLDEKIVLRSDGTSVYITQDLGTAIERFKEFPGLEQLIYTVGNEQDYHFKVLFKTLEKLGYNWAKECYHLSYGMVELPEGKMKSREGTVVDADELLQEMYNTAETTTKELGKVEGFTEKELKELYRTVSLGALKYFILKVDPKKKMMFDPKESIDFNGHTGPFIQYTHARIKSVLRKATAEFNSETNTLVLNAIEKEIVKSIYDFDSIVEEAGKTYSPALVANYTYELTKLYNRFYHEVPILKEEIELTRNFRLQLSKTCAQTLSNAMNLLGIEVPERM